MLLKYYIYLNFAASVFVYVSGITSFEGILEGCPLPEHPVNGQWTIQGGAKAKTGSRVPLSTILNFQCNFQYKLSGGNRLVVCLKDGWSTAPPTCLRDGCALPENPLNGRWIIRGGAKAEPGTIVNLNTILTYECNFQYKLSTESSLMVCLEDGWSTAPPTCLNECPPLYSDNIVSVTCYNANRSQEVSCEYPTDGTTVEFDCVNPKMANKTFKPGLCHDGQWNASKPNCAPEFCPTLYNTNLLKVKCFNKYRIEIKCDAATSGSSAVFECARYYEPIERVAATRYCWNGFWNLDPPQCVPVCGQMASAQPFVINGKDVKRGNYPWVTAIYRNIGGEFQFKCGGSMLTQRVIITAAHCVTNDYGDAILAREVNIAVGKYYSDYNHPNDTLAQISKITGILVHSNYKGESQRFGSDIAFLITRDQLKFSKVVQPICFQNLRQFILVPGMEGVITGWGVTNATDPYSTPSNVLKELKIPFTDDATCLRGFPKEWTDYYLTYDKMCAGHQNKSMSVCVGDSGGGLAFPHYGRYYIHGLVSIGQRNLTHGCDVQLSSLYTKVTEHYDWLERVTSEYV